MVPLGLAGLATSTPLSGRSPWAASSAAGDSANRGCRHLDRHRFAAERVQHVAIGRVARTGDRYPVARLEHRQERQHESRGGAGREHDAFGIDHDAVSFGVMTRNAPAQRCIAERRRVANSTGGKRGLRRRKCRRRRGGRRLADFHMNYPPAGRLKARRRRNHIHNHECRYVAAR
jgi:hypothetical protein